MNKKLQSFTLIEQLLVLLITASIIFLGAVQFQTVKATFVENHFIQAFEARYLYAQKLAIINGNSTLIKVNKKEGWILFNFNFRNEYISIPSTVAVKKAPDNFVFKNYSGHGGPLSSYIFGLDASKKEVTYSLQMGNMRYVKKEEKI